jgi:hypothetical protein
MIKVICVAVIFFGVLEVAIASGDECGGIGLLQAHKSTVLHGSSVCFVYSKTSSQDGLKLSRDPDEISLYAISESERPELLYEFPYAGTQGKINDVFFLAIEGAAEEMLFVIHSMQSPKSWDTKSDIYDVSVIRHQGGILIRDQKLSRFFDLGGDLVDTQGKSTYLYPYKDKKSVEGAVRSALFRAINSSTKIMGTVQEKTFLYAGDSEPALQDPKKAYLIKGDQVTLADSMAGWCKILYQGKAKLITRWAQCKSIVLAEN